MTDQGADRQGWRGFGVGTVIAGYRLEERIGAGGMAVVFRAHDARLDRQVALKLLAPGLNMDEASRQRFVRESRAAASVDHPHIIPVFDAGEADGVLYIAMRYVRGRDVRSLIDRSGPLPPGQVAEIVSQMASALDAAHARGLIHRDVKPANMLLEARPAGDLPGHAYLSDFGLTKAAMSAEMALTAAGEFLGTLEYVAPEQISGQPLSGRCDQYGLACSAFEMLCGQPPFRAQQSLTVMYAHLHEPPPPLAALRRELPGGLDAVLGRALAKDPAGRYGSCGEFAAALRQVLAGAGAGSPQPQPVPPLTARDPVPASTPASRADAGRPGPGDTVSRPGVPRAVTVPAAVAAGTGPAGETPPRRFLGLRAVLAGLAALAVLAGGGYLVASRAQHGPGVAARDPRAPASRPAPAVVPLCTQATAPGPKLASVTSARIAVPAAFGVAASGHYAFVTGNGTVTVLQDGTAGAAPAVLRTISVPGAGKSSAVTHDGKYLLAAAGSGAVVLSVADAVSGAQPVLGTLTGTGGNRGADEVVLSADDQYAFVSLQAGPGVAVFNLQEALASGFTTSGFVGTVPVNGPTGMAAAGDSLFVTAEGGTAISVISMTRAQQDPARAVLHRVPAGCNPARAAVSPDGKELWVTAYASDALLGYSTALLRSDPARALNADVRVGESPLGVVVVNGGRQVIVVDSDQAGAAGKTSSLAVVDTASALARRPALRGYLSSGELPRDAVMTADGQTVLVAVSNSRQVQAVSTGTLP